MSFNYENQDKLDADVTKGSFFFFENIIIY